MNGNEGAGDGRRLSLEETAGFDSMAHVLSLKFRRADAAFKRTIEKRVKDTGVYRSQHRLLMHLNMQPVKVPKLICTFYFCFYLKYM